MNTTAAKSSLLIGVSLFSLMIAWSFLTPLFSGPDEPSNFIRSAAVVRGEWVGENYPASLDKSYWTTYVHIDPQFGTANAIPWCFAPFPEKPGCGISVEDATVVDIPTWTNMGRYPPLPFLISGLGTILGPTDNSVRLARMMTSGFCACLLALAVDSLRAKQNSLVGLLLAITPGTLFLASAMNPSSIEICSAIAVWATLPQLIHNTKPNRVAKLTFLIAGVSLLATRPIGIVMYLITLIISWLTVGSSNVSKFIRDNRITAVIHLLVGLLMMWWYVAVYSFQTSPSLASGSEMMALSKQISTAVRHIPVLLDHIVGNFGWLDTPMPRLALLLYFLVLAFVMWSSVVQVNFRSRISLATLAALCFILSIAIDVNFYSMFGWFGAQGRHIAPILVGFPILAVYQKPVSQKISQLAVLAWAVVQIWSGFAALRRYTVGIKANNAFEMFSAREWNPYIGFWPAVGFLVISTFAVVALVLSNLRAQVDPSTRYI